MKDLIQHQAEIKRVERFQALKAGHYWRAVQQIPEQGIDKDEVLLLQSIRWVNNAAHTIIMLPHPSKIETYVKLKVPQADESMRQTGFTYKEHRFLLADFLAKFEFEPDHQAIREREIAAVQGRTIAIQQEIAEFQSDPAVAAKIVDEGLSKLLPAPTDESPSVPDAQDTQAGVQLYAQTGGTLVGALKTGITAESIDSMREAVGIEQKVATIKTNWLKSKTDDIASTIKSLLPYYKEVSSAALAASEEVFAQVEKMQQGIASLDMYIGTGVHVEHIRKGQSAPADVKLTLQQRKLVADEELAAWADVDDTFDFTKLNQFTTALIEHQSLVDQLFSTERGVLVMTTTRRHLDYGHPLASAAMNEKNQEVFLLVRDGENLFKIHSPVESHLRTGRLFPSKDDHDQLFRGLDGSEISFENVAYTDKLKAHELHALHYKRFLILLCGLDHRLNLFGDFYTGPKSFHFVTMRFQEDHLHFLHDDDGSGLIAGPKRLALRDWMAEKNAYLRSGSRVLCNWYTLLNPTTAPGAAKEETHRRGYDLRYHPATSIGVAVVYQSGDNLCVDVQVTGRVRSMNVKKTITCKVNLSAYRPGVWSSGSGYAYLCLDAASDEDVNWYIHNRESREGFLDYINFFKLSRDYLAAEAETERDTRGRLAQALEEGSIASGKQAVSIVQRAVVAWRAANRGRALPVHGSDPKSWKSLLDQMFLLAGVAASKVGEVEQFLANLGYSPLRFVLSGTGAFMVYAAPKQSERDDRLEPHAWAHLITLDRKKTGLAEKSRRWTQVPRHAAAETTVHEWGGVGEWSTLKSAFPSFAAKQLIMGIPDQALATAASIMGPFDDESFAKLFHDWDRAQKTATAKSSQVESISIQIPVAVLWSAYSSPVYVSATRTEAHTFLYHQAPTPEWKTRVRAAYIDQYQSKWAVAKQFDDAANKSALWSLKETSVTYADSSHGVFAHIYLGVGSYSADGHERSTPLLADWFARWRAKSEESGKKVWTGFGVTDERSRLAIDAALGNELPAGFRPLDVHTSTLSKRFPDADQRADEYIIIDICEPDTKRLENTGFGYSSSYASVDSYDAALARRDSQLAALGPVKVVPAGEVPETLKAPNGVERLIMVRIDDAQSGSNHSVQEQ